MLVSFFKRFYDHREGPEYIYALKVQPPEKMPCLTLASNAAGTNEGAYFLTEEKEMKQFHSDSLR